MAAVGRYSFRSWLNKLCVILVCCTTLNGAAAFSMSIAPINRIAWPHIDSISRATIVKSIFSQAMCSIRRYCLTREIVIHLLNLNALLNVNNTHRRETLCSISHILCQMAYSWLINVADLVSHYTAFRGKLDPRLHTTSSFLWGKLDLPLTNGGGTQFYSFL